VLGGLSLLRVFWRLIFDDSCWIWVNVVDADAVAFGVSFWVKWFIIIVDGLEMMVWTVVIEVV